MAKGSIATFGDFLRSDAKWIWVHCNSRYCYHKAAAAFAPLAIRWGMDAPVTLIRERFRCSHCGEKVATTTAPSWDVMTKTWQIYPVAHGLRVVPAHAWLDAMCNLYSLNKTREGVGKLFRVSHNRMATFDSQLTLFPGHMAPVIRLASDGERELVNLSWGFVLLMDGKAPRRVTNVRDDKIRDSAFWKPSYQERRCLVLASSFCEPKSVKPATWYWFG